MWRKQIFPQELALYLVCKLKQKVHEKKHSPISIFFNHRKYLSSLISTGELRNYVTCRKSKRERESLLPGFAKRLKTEEHSIVPA